MNLWYLAFSDRGAALAARLARALGGRAQRCGDGCDLRGWTAAHFAPDSGLVFVGAAGIAVRAIAPHVASKASDPAVVAVDERGRFSVALLSGHLGGANDLARRVAAACGATPVVTTATDVNGVFAVDAWARHQNAALLEPEKIKGVSAALLAGGRVTLHSDWPLPAPAPAGIVYPAQSAPCQVRLSLHPDPAALNLVPRILVLGVGCRRGTPAEALETALAGLLAAAKMPAAAICAAATIDLKEKEPGLRAFCGARGWPLSVFPAAQLAAVPGRFTGSDFVKATTGVDNVCERSAVLAAGGALVWPKIAGNGVTMALAAKPYAPDWRWNDG